VGSRAGRRTRRTAAKKKNISISLPCKKKGRELTRHQRAKNHTAERNDRSRRIAKIEQKRKEKWFSIGEKCRRENSRNAPSNTAEGRKPLRRNKVRHSFCSDRPEVEEGKKAALVEFPTPKNKKESYI